MALRSPSYQRDTTEAPLVASSTVTAVLDRWWSRRRRPLWAEFGVVAMVAAVGAALVFRRSLLGPGVLSAQDYSIITMPFQSFIDSSWGRGEVPLWSPDLLFGVPFLANGDTFVFYPLQPFFVFMDAARGLAWQIWLHATLGTITMYWFARRSLNISPAGSMLAAIVVVYGGFTLSHLGFITFVHVLPWTPLLLLSFERAINRSLAWCWVGAMAMAMVLLAGLPQLTYYVLLWSPAFLAVVVFRHSDSWRPRATRAAVALVGSTVGGVLLAAVQVLPQSELVAESHRGDGLSLGEAALAAYPTDLVPTVLLPDYSDRFFGENAAWVGAVVALLVVVGVVSLVRRGRGPEAALWSTMAVVSVALAVGPEGTPLFELAFEAVPGFDRFRIPARLLYPMTLAVAVLGAHGADEVIRSLRPASWRRTAWSLAALVVVGAVAAPRLLWLLTQWDQRRWIIGSTVIGLALAGFAVVAGRLGRLDRSVAAGLLVLAVSAELLGAGYFMEWNRTFPAAIYSTDERAIPRFLADEVGDDTGRVISAFPPDPFFTEQISRLSANTPLYDEIASTDGFGGTWPTAPAEVFLLAVHPSLRGDSLETVDVLRLMGVEWIVTSEDQAGLVGSDQIEVVLTDEDRVLLRLSEPGRRIRTYCGAEFIDDEDEVLARVTAPDVDLDRLLLTGTGSSTGGRACGEAEIVEASSRSLTVDVEVPDDGWLFVADSWYPGWTATVDGEPVEIERAMGAFRAVRVPAGAHEVVFDYPAATFWLGAAVSSTALVVWAVSLAGFMWWGRRARSAHEPL